ncbi:MAG TPA: hypothetical protein VN203_01880, partial [Candidatus Acidoferrum sp.]|nr:hypothetical protein [Candidatus Acidoferrum sp.]
GPFCPRTKMKCFPATETGLAQTAGADAAIPAASQGKAIALSRPFTGPAARPPQVGGQLATKN